MRGEIRIFRTLLTFLKAQKFSLNFKQIIFLAKMKINTMYDFWNDKIWAMLATYESIFRAKKYFLNYQISKAFEWGSKAFAKTTGE